MDLEDAHYLKLAINQAFVGVNSRQGGPFGALIVKQGEIIVSANNMVLVTNDPTAHAEMVAIRQACLKLNSYQLDDCVLYASCEPCPMCLGAIYWARPIRLVYACSREDAAKAGFDDSMIYKEVMKTPENRLIPTVQIILPEASIPFKAWEGWKDKSLY
ncbi:MAG: nucleoside deaminase [Saprospiraceae bacterium]